MAIGQIYLLTFTSGKQYVGKTTQSLQARLHNHKSGSLAHRNGLVGYEWLKCGAPKIELLGQYEVARLHGAERGWMLKLNTHYPNGLNKN